MTKDIELVIKIPERDYDLACKSSDALIVMYTHYIKNGTPLSKIVDSLKELSKDHRHNYIGISHEERAWQLGIEDSIDLILAESEK